MTTPEAQVAINAASDAAVPEWKDLAERVLLKLAATQLYITTDDLWLVMNQQHPDVDTPEHRAVGAVMKKGARNGWIIKTDRTLQSMLRVCHGRDKRVWQSLVHPDAKVCPWSY